MRRLLRSLLSVVDLYASDTVVDCGSGGFTVICGRSAITASSRRLNVKSVMHIRHPAVVDAIAPPGVTTDNVEKFSRVELRSLHW
jgi:hypothetical protein